MIYTVCEKHDDCVVVTSKTFCPICIELEEKKDDEKELNSLRNEIDTLEEELSNSEDKIIELENEIQDKNIMSN